MKDVRYIVEYNKMNFSRYISFKIIGHNHISSNYTNCLYFGNNVVIDATSFIYKNFIYNDVFYKDGRAINFIDSDMRDLINKYNIDLRLKKLKKIDENI